MIQIRQDEKELDKLVQEVEDDRFIGTPPTFEIAVTTLSLLMTITLFIFPELMYKGHVVYDSMRSIMPSYMWALAFLLGSLLKGIGLLRDAKFTRYAGLAVSAMLYFLLSLAFATDFPTLASLTYGVLSIYAVVSMQQVKYTSIINKREE